VEAWASTAVRGWGKGKGAFALPRFMVFGVSILEFSLKKCVLLMKENLPPTSGNIPVDAHVWSYWLVKVQ
jgi:hypothetical protein